MDSSWGLSGPCRCALRLHGAGKSDSDGVVLQKRAGISTTLLHLPDVTCRMRPHPPVSPSLSREYSQVQKIDNTFPGCSRNQRSLMPNKPTAADQNGASTFASLTQHSRMMFPQLWLVFDALAQRRCSQETLFLDYLLYISRGLWKSSCFFRVEISLRAGIEL